jgi:hypothetical protein
MFVFPCNRWLARDEDDKAIERDLVAEKIIDEKYDNGEVRTKEKKVRDRLTSLFFLLIQLRKILNFKQINFNSERLCGRSIHW